jgi:malate dehydrogenase (oxaloacetate-decarboxylating)
MKITDNMAIRAAHSIAEFAQSRGISPDNIMPNMLESELFPTVAAEVAMQAIQDGVALNIKSKSEVYLTAKQDIEESHAITRFLQENGFIKEFPEEIILNVVKKVEKML